MGKTTLFACDRRDDSVPACRARMLDEDGVELDCGLGHCALEWFNTTQTGHDYCFNPGGCDGQRRVRGARGRVAHRWW